MKLNRNLLLVIVAAVVVIGLFLQSGEQTGPDSATIDSTATTAAVLEDRTDDVAEVRFSDLPTISTDDLPIEAIETLLLIDDGGPYPFDRDDLTFQNREGILPDRSAGHYREYTVITPGESDRGARRIVSGADGERYYTADHYQSFREILFDQAGAG